MSAASQRQRRHRDRQRAGKVVLTVEVSEVSLVEQLVLSGFLQPAEIDDRETVRAALERVVRLWAQGVTRNGAAV